VTERQPAGIDRRTVLKGAGVGAGLAWAVPVVLASPAAAATTSGRPTTGCASCGPDACLDQPRCGAVGPGLPECRCSVTLNGACVCTRVVACAAAAVCGPGLPACPPGTVCVASCCDAPRCLPLCVAA